MKTMGARSFILYIFGLGFLVGLCVFLYGIVMTTGAPAVRPSRSSRTKDSSPQISCAHDR